MMLYPSVNKLREKVDSSYTLCILAAKRARDIIEGMPILTEVEAERPVSLATNEISEDMITYRRIEEQSKEETLEAAAIEEVEEEPAVQDTEDAVEEVEAETESSVEA